MEPLTWFLTGMEKHSDSYNASLYGDGESFFRSMFYHMSRMQTQSALISMNELSNHDHSRFMTRTNRTVGRLASMGAAAASEGIHPEVYREAVLVQMTCRVRRPCIMVMRPESAAGLIQTTGELIRGAERIMN